MIFFFFAHYHIFLFLIFKDCSWTAGFNGMKKSRELFSDGKIFFKASYRNRICKKKKNTYSFCQNVQDNALISHEAYISKYISS